MEVIPAIDLRGGRCVRLYQGDYAQETVFSDDPVAVAERWEGLGAPRLHLVDLDGAESGEPRNMDSIAGILEAVRIPVQLGGGIRTLEMAERLLGMGLARIILGTAAIKEPSLVEEACRRFGEGIVVSIDARDGLVATHGWRHSSEVSAGELAERMAALGVRRFIYTDIWRDGTLTEPNFEAIARLISLTRLPVIAAGGISSIAHLRRLAQLGAEGAIVGRALYTGDLDLAEALGAV